MNLIAKRKLIQYLGIFLIFSLIGHFLSFYFYDQSLNRVEDQEMIGFYNDFGVLNLGFSLSIGILPFLYLTGKKLSFLKSKIELIAFVILTISSGVFLWQYRILKINESLRLDPNQKPIDFDDLQLESYWFIGLLLGSILSLIIFKLINKVSKQTKNIW
ncbi:hypothetical protein [Aquimarina sp. LLG6339-5]|uniref:hypothetical protein n=1 Tax=Aquimarina sp. LLG6339-5 TaxID=3160830 RepID=UPI0038630E70